MNNPTRQTNRSITRGGTFALLALLMGIAVTSPAWMLGRADDKRQAGKHHDKRHHGDKHRGIEYRWDIIHAAFTPTNRPVTVDPGGLASAMANDGTLITFMGSGTFTIKNGQGHDRVEGGGVWETRDTNSVVTASGTYRVTGLVSFVVIPGSSNFPDTIDNVCCGNDAARGGLAVFRIGYSDGTTGVLTVSCHAQVGAPDSVFEGITASKGFVDYWNRVAPPAPPGDANRTVFHVLSDDGGDDDDDD